MTFDLLTTKLHAPSVHARLIGRPQLFERISRELDRGLTLISAPAGFGKTTLVAQWLAAVPLRVAWLSLDEQDSEPVRFLTYLVHALQAVVPIGEAVLQNLGSDAPPSLEPVLASFLNEIAELEDGIVLVLDDYHEIDSETIDRLLAYLVEHRPSVLKMVITSREDPPIPLARMRARGELAEFRADDLKFSTAEATAFLRQTVGLSVAPAHVRVLRQRTEVWAAGL